MWLLLLCLSVFKPVKIGIVAAVLLPLGVEYHRFFRRLTTWIKLLFCVVDHFIANGNELADVFIGNISFQLG